LGAQFSDETFNFLSITNITNKKQSYIGKIASYNSNTFKGRVYIEDEGRPVPFEISEGARSVKVIKKIVRSLSANAVDAFDDGSKITFDALRYESKLGRLKGFLILAVD
jgi:hypothetical protein